MSKSVGIISVAAWIPTEVRPNSYWDPNLVRQWKERLPKRLDKIKQALASETSEVARLTIERLEAMVDDPWQGIKERRVMPKEMKSWDMEVLAAKEAIERAGIDKSEIDVVMSHQICPDYLNLPSAPVVHGKLGLRETAMSLGADAVCNSFLTQLTLAKALVQSGQAKYVLCTQSSAFSRIPASGEPIDCWGGDMASAVIVGEVSEGNGILSYTHHTDGTLWGALVLTTPGEHWTTGRCEAYSEDPPANLNMVSRIAERGQQVVEEALAMAGLRPEQVGFYTSHQAFHWLRPITHEVCGLENAKFVDHFHYLGTGSSVNLGLQLAVGEKEGLLRPGDVVACFQGGTGMTWSGMTMRWGR